MVHWYFSMTPDLVRPHIGRIEILFRRIEHHPMDCTLFVQLGILNVLIQTTRRIHTEHIQKSCVIIEWIPVDIVRRLFGRKNEYRSSLRIRIIRSRCVATEFLSLSRIRFGATYGVHPSVMKCGGRFHSDFGPCTIPISSYRHHRCSSGGAERFFSGF